jgi:hypothetical protein
VNPAEEILALLRASGVRAASFTPDGNLASVEFFPAVWTAPATPAEDRPLPKPPRTDDEKLFGPLRIGSEGQAK